MDVREKLVELLTDNLPRIGNLPKCDNPLQYTMDEIVERIADHLVAHGVTVQEWISASEPPEEHDSIWAKLYGTKSWQPGLFRKCSYDVLACVEKKDGSRRVISIRTYDGKWDNNKLNEETVICWQSMPQPPKGETIYCKDCEHLMFSDCYGECANGHKGIVNPNDTCEHAKRKPPKGE